MNDEDRRITATASAWALYIATMFTTSGCRPENWSDSDIDVLVETACTRHGADHNRIRWYCENRIRLDDCGEDVVSPFERAQFTRVAARLKECGYESF